MGMRVVATQLRPVLYKARGKPALGGVVLGYSATAKWLQVPLSFGVGPGTQAHEPRALLPVAAE